MTEVVRASDETLPERALKYLGLHPDNPVTWVLAMLARKYDLDPLLGEVSVITTKQGLKPYVTRDGLLTVAHRSGQFDGITVDELREGETGWACTVTVWRKDMTHGFTFSAGCGKQEPQAQQGNGPEMALARAERRALHRAFNVPSMGADWDELDQQRPLAEDASAAVVEGASPTPPPRSRPPAPQPHRREEDAIRVLMAQAGIMAWSTEQKRNYVESIIGHPMTTLAELSETDRAMVIGDLRAIIDLQRAEPERPVTDTRDVSEWEGGDDAGTA